ncbi:MAG: sugar ABC transporter permease [Deltaproteobacteria bacterium]|nr:sugar ABC transporter permease [Deltaproteobacteria bacterium]MBW2120584.1 sugar ABC transporter permease [Deltaproteobacteria bacterium]
MEAEKSGLAYSAVTQETAVPTRKKKKSKGYLLIWPAFAFVLFFLIIYPFGYNVYQSFFEYSMLTDTSRFVGFGNYIGLFTKIDYLRSLWTGGLIAVVSLAIETVLGLAIAIVLNQKFKGRVVARILLILPLGTIPVINGYMFNVLFFPNASVVDHILNFLGLVHGPIPWLQDPTLARIVIILLDVWQWTSFMIIILLAGLSAIPESSYELARLDNMSKWTTFWRITLPKIKFPLALAMLIRGMDLLKFFDGVFALTKGGPQSATETVSFYIFRTGFRTFNIGFASAASVIVWAIIWVAAFIVITKMFGTSEAKA